jgi:undecaprenyl-diphosphatase
VCSSDLRCWNYLTSMSAHQCYGHVDTSFVALGPVKVAFLGLVQGISELLPISSSAHMRVIPAILGWDDPGSAFSAAMQLAALLAVITYFRAEIRSIIVGSASAVRRRDWHDRELRFGVGIILATVPIVVAGELLASTLNECNSPLRTPTVIGIACVAMALLLGAAEIFASRARDAARTTILDALLIGIAQIGALLPGVSRSGSTLTAAMFLGFNREDAARISFLLGIPAIALAGGKELWVLAQTGLTAYGWSVLAVGLAVSSVSAFVAIWALMRYLEHASTWPLVIYRALFGLVLIVAVSQNWIH